MKKLIVLLMSFVFAITPVFATGCARTGGYEIDENKTQLYVGLEQSGFGRDWMDAIIKDFEAANATKNFEDGKTGVQVILMVKEYNSQSVLTSMKYADEDMYFINNMAYYDYVSRLDGGSSEYLVDITDAITEGGENSIYNRMYDSEKEYYNLGTENNPKLYAISFVQTFWGLVYDKDLFSSKGLYSLAYAGLDGEIDTADDLLGPDGQPNTVDDGLPATFEDFKVLVEAMVQRNILPFTWSGALTDYRNKFLNTIIASYEGVDNFKMRYNWDGDFNGEKIDKYNAWKLTDQEGVKAMLTFADYVTSNSKFYSSDLPGDLTNGFDSSSNTEAQDRFLANGNIFTDKKPIGFLVEGSWWEQEAKKTIERRVEGKGNFGFLPFPKFIGTDGVADQTNDKSILCNSVSPSSGGVFVSSSSKKIELAKEFIKFFFSEQSSAKFTTITNLFQPYEYALSDSQYNGLSTYAKDIYQLSRSPYAETLTMHVSNPDYIAKQNDFKDYWECTSIVDRDALSAFYFKDTTTIDSYLDAYKAKFSQTNWPIK